MAHPLAVILDLIFPMYSSVRKALCCACLFFLSAALGACTESMPLGPDLADAAPVVSSNVDDIVRLTNEVRGAHGMAALTISDSLVRAAQIQARQMADARTMAHELPGARYPTLESRAEAVGYQFSWIAENIAYGYTSTEQVMNGWTHSKPHLDNILDDRVAEIGVAIAVAADGVPYYATVLGRRR